MDRALENAPEEAGFPYGGAKRGSRSGFGRFLRPLLQTRGPPHSVSGDRAFWDQLRNDGFANSAGWLELDLFGYARVLIKRFLAGAEDDGTRALKEIEDKCEFFHSP